MLQILKADLLLIDRTPAIKTLISSRPNDISLLIRESSLRLISKCIKLTLELGTEMMPNFSSRTLCILVFGTLPHCRCLRSGWLQYISKSSISMSSKSGSV